MLSFLKIVFWGHVFSLIAEGGEKGDNLQQMVLGSLVSQYGSEGNLLLLLLLFRICTLK